MAYKIQLNLTRWLILLITFTGTSYFFIYQGAIFLAAAILIATYWVVFYARPTALLLLDEEVEFSLFGIKTKIPYKAISVLIANTNKELKEGVDDISRLSGTYPLKWVYWLIIFSGFTIFIAITLKEGYNVKIARASIGFIIVGSLFIFLLQKITYKILSIRIKSTVLNIFINSSHVKTLNKWPFSYYKSRFFIYQLGLISVINKDDLKYMINVFKEKLNTKQLHKTVIQYEKEIS